MVDFSGGFSEETYTKNVTADELFTTMTDAFEKSSLMTCSTSSVNESLTGLMRDHVYTITRGKFFRINESFHSDYKQGAYLSDDCCGIP